MKKILTTIALSLSAIIATSAMAAPDHRYDQQRYQPSHHGAKHDDRRWDQHNRHDNKRVVNPSRDWRAGQTLPRIYDSSRYKVSDREVRRLPQSGRYQQWYKVNGDYVLVNERNNRIVRIVN